MLLYNVRCRIIDIPLQCKNVHFLLFMYLQLSEEPLKLMTTSVGNSLSNRSSKDFPDNYSSDCYVLWII